MAPAPSVVKNATIPFAGLDGKLANATGVNCKPFFSVTTSEQGLEIFADVKGNSAYITYAIAQIFFIYVATYTYISVLKNQDQLFQKYNEMSMIGGAVGFILIGIPVAILSPFFGYDVGFIELFFGFAIGSVLNGYRFYKIYIKED